ncbi:MAG: MobF family relaxase [Cyanobacteria bacterium P01_G01_bin.67]
MLTIKNVNAELAKTYFEKGYYQKGRWFGQGAASLNLTGEIEAHDAYNNLLDGQSPDGTQSLMGRKIKGTKHRAAIDCTFNAPKSVSLQALVSGDSRLIEAHRQAVNQTLELMESRYAQSRILKKGQPRQVVSTSKLAVAQFDHIETRDLDPHLHTHCVVMNVTQRGDGQWRSLHNDAIYRQQKLLGMVYQHNLAKELMKLGYQVKAKQHGQFEIAGYSKQDLESFSKRRQQILAETGEGASVLERNIAWGNTRVKKEVVSPSELKEKWQQEASQLGVQFVSPNPTPVSQTSTMGPHKVNDAISHCEERAVAFRLEDLEKFLLNSGQPIKIESLDKTITQNSSLINVSDNLSRRYTTEAALQRELATIRLMLEGKNQQHPICPQPLIKKTLDPISLTEGQHEAISTALSTRDGVMAWHGVAGAGKTYALNHFTNLAQQNGYHIKGFAPSAEAAKVLGNEVGIKADTVASLLYSKPSQPVETNQIWLVDEAGLLSAKAAYELLQRAKAEKARVLLVGDTRQLSAVEAGNPFKSLQAAGMTTARMNQSLRQRIPELQTAVDLISKGEIDAGFGLLNQANCLIEVTEEEKINQIVSDYLKIPQADREKILVLAGTNAERLAITQSIRQGLKKKGFLGEGVKITQLKSKDLTRVQMRFTHHLEIGDLVSPVFDYKQRQLSKGKLYEIIDKDVDTLTLSDSTGNIFKVDPLFEKAVYHSSDIEIAPGDRLKWNKNDRKQGRRNGQEFTVKAIEGTTATIEYKDGKQDTFDLSVPQHLDYGLVSTTYSSQGKTAERVLISADYTIGKESFYVAVSRVKSDLKLYTSDLDNLLELAKASRAKENPLELLRARQRASVKVKRLTKERGADGKEESSLMTQNVSTSVIEAPPNVSNLPQETDEEIKTPNEADTNLSKKLKQANDTLAKSNQISDQNQQRLKELEQRLIGDKNQKQTQQNQPVKKPPIPKKSSNYPSLKPTVKPSINQPRSSDKTQPSRSKKQRLADLNNLPAILALTRLMRLLDIPPKKGWRRFERPPYTIKVSTDYETVELSSSDGRGLILLQKDGKIKGNLNQEDRELIALINPEIDQRLDEIEQKRMRQSQQRSRDDGFSL